MIRDLFAVAVMFVLAGSAAADHIDGHNNDDPIFPVPIPGQEFFDGGILFVTALGPFGGSEITNTVFDINFVSDGATPASDLLIYVSYFSKAGFLDFHLTGADLGFGSGPGVFVGSFSTDALNGITVESFFPPYSLINLEIGAVGGQIDGSGYFEDSFINFRIGIELGDVNLDGAVDLLDVQPFVDLLISGAFQAEADINQDGVVDLLDVQPFVDLLTG